MHLFLTSHIGGHLHQGDEIYPEMLLEENGFLAQLQRLWRRDFRCLMIANNPYDEKMNDLHAKVFCQSFEVSGLSFSDWTILDQRNQNMQKAKIQQYDFILLLGGHVPTQNAFFTDIRLAEKLQGYQGIIAGISAGTMNCADEVYSIPELEGEAKDKAYQRFLPGLHLTHFQVIPHYQWLRQVSVDGYRMIEDLAVPDSMERVFYLLPDGSYIHQTEQCATLHGEGYILSSGVIRKLSENGETYLIPKER